MSRAHELERMKEMKEKLLEAGGDEKKEQQKKKGKMTSRDRIDSILDKKSFIESFPYITSRSTDFGMEKHRFPGDGVVTGTGLIDGRQVCLSSQDFTVLGGSLGEQQAERINRAQNMALKTRTPFIQINDSGGARIQEGVYSLDGYGKIFRSNIDASGVIPQLSLILGPCAGGAVYSPALTDFVFMVEKVSQMYITGPDVIKAVMGEEVTHEQLGGASTHSKKSGNAHFHCKDEQECFTLVRKLLSYLPSNNMEHPPLVENGDSKSRKTPKVNEVIPEQNTKAYDVRDIIDEVFDKETFLEVHKEYAPSIVVGFARLAGRSVGIIANQPKVLSGTLDINSSDKAARFVRVCDCFNVPVISLVDIPGYMPGTVQEYDGIIRHGAKLLYAIGEAVVPKISLILRKAYGGAYIAMAARSLGYDRVLALPCAEIAVMGAQGAANIIFRREIAASQNPGETRNAKIQEFQESSMNPYVSAAAGFVDDVIAPEDAREELIRSLESLVTKHESRIERKHGNFPV